MFENARWHVVRWMSGASAKSTRGPSDPRFIISRRQRAQLVRRPPSLKTPVVPRNVDSRTVFD
eukprot:1465053-Pyramimonas_sp.AAC.1